MSHTIAIAEIHELTVAYGGVRAVDGVTFSFYPGQSLGLLGVNGAGKTSTIRALLGLVPREKGEVRFPGGVADLRLSTVGFVPEAGEPPGFLTAGEYLDFVASFRIRDKRLRRERICELCRSFEIDLNKRLSSYSKGMKQRVILAQALVGEVSILIMDEPLNGLDPLFIVKVREILSAFRQKGGSLLYSSHILSEVEKICSHVAILSKGQLVCHSSVESLVNKFGSVEQAFSETLREKTV